MFYLNTDEIVALGLFFDIAGAVLLAMEAFKSKKSMLRGSTSTYGHDPHALSSSSYKSWEALFGLFLLILGFLLQGYTYYHKVAGPRLAVLFVLAAIAFIVAYFMARTLASRTTAGLVKEIEQSDKGSQ